MITRGLLDAIRSYGAAIPRLKARPTAASIPAEAVVLYEDANTRRVRAVSAEGGERTVERAAAWLLSEHTGTANKVPAFSNTGAADEKAVGSTAGTLAAGDDARFPSGYSASYIRRKVSSGTTNIAGGAIATLGTFTRNANEIPKASIWAQQNVAAIVLVEDITTGAAARTDGIGYWFARTTNANEYTFNAKNYNATTARDVEWLVEGVVP